MWKVREWEEVSWSTTISNRRGIPRTAGVHQTTCHFQLTYCRLSHDTINFSGITLTSDIATVTAKQATYNRWAAGRTVYTSQLTDCLSVGSMISHCPHIARSCWPTLKLHYHTHLAHRISMHTDHSRSTIALLPLLSRPLVCHLLTLWFCRYRPTLLLLNNCRNICEQLHKFTITSLFSPWLSVPHWKFKHRLQHVINFVSGDYYYYYYYYYILLLLLLRAFI